MIHVGPGWDFDLAFSNEKWANWLGERCLSPRETMIRKEELKPKEFYDENGISNDEYESSLLLSRLFFDLMEIEEFQNEVKDVFRERISGREVEIMGFLAMREENLKQLVKKDGQRWEKYNYNEEMKRLTDWLRERLSYIEEQYGEETVRRSVF